MLKQAIDIYELLDSPKVNGLEVVEFFKAQGIENVSFQTVMGEKGSTDFVRIFIPGTQGKSTGGTAPTLGIVGRLGGIGARPEAIGFVSDGDGCAAALTSALKLGKMHNLGDKLAGDIIINTHICPDAPTLPHEPVPFMDSPVDIITMNQYEVEKEMDAIISLDTTKGNKIMNYKGIAISPTVKEGYILKTSSDLVDILEIVTGNAANVFPLSQQDITPYGNGLYHINSILQPAVATSAPVVGVAITAGVPVPGCATGASHIVDIGLAARFTIEVAKVFGTKQISLYDANEFERIQKLYGSMKVFQTLGEK
ncbi:Protein of unknown function [Desulfonispora thiosulfatigenes DSM 11270]|uniref:DUF1177 domain-containing protein n=1 Tax=Desulfonispora thiosulfatigenes DSM 11270 TaxID=656914 RepID=A0A1W1UKF2_DESTI|nr:DUF1177 domain-containing protein [Desulfonispora thiosulfatigenes]SMB81576.1 Protein of unknown function [Desulfonispora thiosulfatigenes DSM 11270]